MPNTFHHERTQTRVSNGGRTWLWVILPFLFLGFLACLQLFNLAAHSRHGDLIVMGGALLGFPTLVVLAFALRQGLRHVRTFVPTLQWWHWAWALTFISALVFRVRGVNEIGAEPLDAWAVFRIGVDMLVAFILLARLALRRTHWLGSMFRGVVAALTIFGLVGVASTIWSVFVPWTLYKSCEYLIDVALLAGIVDTLDSTDQYRDFFNWTWALYGFLLLSVWGGVALFTEAALHGDKYGGGILGMRLQGVLPAVSANDVATFAGVLGLLSLARLFPISGERSNKSWYTLLLLASLVTMVLAQTRTALAGFMLGAMVILLFSKRGKVGAFLAFIVVPVVALTTMGGLIWSYIQRGQTREDLGTLSARATWWSFAWQTYLERPLTGFGAYAAGRFAVLAKLGLSGTSTMHSDYLEIIVGTSIWGLIPFVVTMVVIGWLLWRCVRNPAYFVGLGTSSTQVDASGALVLGAQERQLAFEALAIFALLGFRSIFMTMLTWHPPLHFLAILGYVEYLRRRRRAGIESCSEVVAGHAAGTDPQLELAFGAADAGSSGN